MNNNSKCFILTSNGYEEITLAELEYRRKTNSAYIDKRFIALHDMLMEVSESDYYDFYKVKRRQKYIDEEANRSGVLSYHALDTDDMSGEEIIVDKYPYVEEQVLKKLDIETMLMCLSKLDEADRKLLIALYFDGKSEQQLSKDTGIPRRTINYRKQRAITRLKKLFKL